MNHKDVSVNGFSMDSSLVGLAWDLFIISIFLTNLTSCVPHVLRVVVGGLESLAGGVNPAELVTVVASKVDTYKGKTVGLNWVTLVSGGVCWVALGLPESLMSLRASLSEKEDMSVAGALAACSKVLKGTLRVYTTSSDSSGLNFDALGWQKIKKSYVRPRSKKLLFCFIVTTVWICAVKYGPKGAAAAVLTFLSSFFALAWTDSSSEELRSEQLDEQPSTTRSFFPFTRILYFRSCKHNTNS